MKLRAFKHQNDYVFALQFANQYYIEVDLAPLLQNYVEPSAIDTAQIDPEWGCLMFKDGMVDIEPKTLYRFATEAIQSGKHKLIATVDEPASLVPAQGLQSFAGTIPELANVDAVALQRQWRDEWQ